MSFELSGRIIEKFDTQQVSESFRKREFVVETEETSGGRQFTEQIKFQLTQDRCELIDGFNIDNEVKVSFNIRGRRWEKEGRVNYFTNLEAWRIENLSPGESGPPMDSYSEADAPNEQGYEDDLPF